MVFLRAAFSKKRRRKTRDVPAKPTLTYAEQKQRRIQKKFGSGGIALGGDEIQRVKLEDEKMKKKSKGKPRVAQSARGRELRAAAALARFGQQKGSEGEVKKGEQGASEDGVDNESDGEIYIKEEDSLDEGITQLRNQEDKGMIKVCGEGDAADDDVKRELEELQEL